MKSGPSAVDQKRRRAAVMACDPGTDNFAVVAVDSHGVLVFARMFRNTIRSLSIDNADQRRMFRAEVRWLLRTLRPNRVVWERFVARRFSTGTSELVNVMMGCLSSACETRNCQDEPVMASTWKNALNRVHSLDDLYAYAKARKVPPHVVDAICMAAYNEDKFRKVRKATLTHNIRLAIPMVGGDKGKVRRDAVPARKKRRRRK